ncbi:hypothetical protein [Vibrio sp. Vb0587]|uniref:hypothetical protein n=1 Tax=Vibrio sp. Vb0587 TaxID=3074626 RepID=UPI002964802F|nr:hypothetical protein [Vibrio sp. Vb0587]MDW1965736.1 hypothetical protein [Vibrio sp. Vb0587]
MNTEQFLNKYQDSGKFLDESDVRELIGCVQQAKASRQKFKEVEANRIYFNFSVIVFYIMIAGIFIVLHLLSGLGVEKFNDEVRTMFFSIFALIAMFLTSVPVHNYVKGTGLNPYKYSLLPGGLAILFDREIITDHFNYRNLEKASDEIDESSARRYSVIKSKGQIPYAIVDRFTGSSRDTLVHLLKIQFKEMNDELYDARQRDFDNWFNSVNNGATHNWDKFVN